MRRRRMQLLRDFAANLSTNLVIEYKIQQQ
jgi:hypothetical protein